MDRLVPTITGIGIIALGSFGSATACVMRVRAQSPEISQPAPPPQPAPDTPPALLESADADSSQEPPPSAADAPVEMVVVGERRTAVQRLQESAEAVNVISMRKAQEQTADLGEVLARTQGVAVRRDGGLGSNTRFSLNGLQDDQVRFFFDGVPLEQAGFPFGVANVPVNFVDHVETYRGVVPIRFGADALGGAISLVTPSARQSYFGASYQVGSFGTHRVTVEGLYRDEQTGFVLRHAAFLDQAKNNYDVDVEVADARGRETPVTVPRFHDGYHAFGASLEAGVTDRPWAKRLLLKAFGSAYDKQLQNNAVMTVPYGEVTYGETVYGSTARYDVALRSNVDLEVTANYSHRIIDYLDAGLWYYDWFGHRIRRRDMGGEVLNKPSDQTIWQNAGFGRVLVSWEALPEHTLRVSLSPTGTTRTGVDRLTQAGVVDPQSAKNMLFTFVSGLEYEIDLFDDRLSNIAFVKDYAYSVSAEEPLPAGGGLRARSTDSHTQGGGDALRVRITPWLFAKVSYEYATRTPRPDEVFGNGVLTRSNLTLVPEVSHNANLGPRIEINHTPAGDFMLDINAFLRVSDHLIVLLSNERTSGFDNVFKARALGLENALSWMAPKRWLSLDGMFTWQDIRNDSNQGDFADTEGDRIPNRPYLFGSWAARLHFSGIFAQGDSLEPFYIGRYVHSFYRGWESLGSPGLKSKVDAQVTHDLGVTWIVDDDYGRLTTTLEVQNVTDAKVFDNYGVQRPGRAIYVKLTGTVD